VQVHVTVTLGGKPVPLDRVKDPRLASAFRAAGAELGQKLEALLCPDHHRPASDVRVRFDAKGAIDLQYDSCCAKLGEVIGRALGG